MVERVSYKGAANRFRSPKIWGNLPVRDWAVGDGGIFVYDDFVNIATLSTTNTTLKYASFGEDSGTIAQAVTEGGHLVLTTGTTDNDEMSIGTHNSFVAIDEDGIYEVAFEARLKKSTVTDNGLAFFIGLMEEGEVAADTLVDDTGIPADLTYIGFNVPQDNGDSVDFVYNVASSSAQRVPIADLCAITADTFFKVGFRVSKDFPSSKRIKVFYDVDGTGTVESTTYIPQNATSTYGVDDTSFPDDDTMGMVFAIKNGGGASANATLDWWACGAGV